MIKILITLLCVLGIKYLSNFLIYQVKKGSPMWKGPYKVVAVKEPNAVVSNGNKEQLVRTNRLKLFEARNNHPDISAFPDITHKKDHEENALLSEHEIGHITNLCSKGKIKN